MNSGPDLDGLKNFIAEGDRTKPVYFAGRKAEIEGLQALTQHARKEGQTRIIAAAPGTGKTALLNELASSYAKTGTARPVRLNAEFFANPQRVMKTIFRAVDQKAAGRVGASFLGLGTSGKAGHQVESSTQHTMLPDTFEDMFEMLEDAKTPIVLLVDEAQNWGADQEAGNGKRISSLLSEAHQNSGQLPLLIIAAGLGDTRDALRRCGVPRLTANAQIPLELLSGDEQREVCKAFFDRFRIIGDESLRNQWAGALVQETGGYPKHLTNALFGAAEALINGGGDLAQSSLKAARDSANGFRRQFYYDQTEPFQRMPELLDAVFDAMPENAGAVASTIEDAIDAAYEVHSKLDRRMPRNRVFTKLLHQGLIQDVGYDRYDCPIPGMRKHVMAFSA